MWDTWNVVVNVVAPALALSRDPPARSLLIR